MRLLTPEGQTVPVRSRSWQLAGADFKYPVTQGNQLLRMGGDSKGTLRTTDVIRLYRENPWVYACVRTLVNGLSRFPVYTYALKADGQRERQRSDLPGSPGRVGAGQRLDRLQRKPYPLTGPKKHWRGVLTDYFIHGNALVTKDDRDASGAPTSLRRAKWKQVEVEEGDETPVLYYAYNGTKERRILAPEDVVHFSVGDDPEQPVGVSPIASLRWTLALHESIQRHLVAFFQNQARPSGNLKLEKGASRETMDFIRDQIRDLYTAPENAGKVIVTTGDYQALTSAPDQLSLIDLAKLSREEIAAVFRIPAPVIGILDHAIKSNVKELREQYVRDGCGPWAAALEDDMQAQLLDPEPQWANYFCEFDLDQALRPDFEARMKAYKDSETTYTTNERRRMENQPDLPYEEADTVVTAPGGGYLGVQEPVTMGPEGDQSKVQEPAAGGTPDGGAPPGGD